jgi:hypothetical protein
LVLRGRNVDLQPVFFGMEEEGIPFEVQQCPSGEAVGVAKEAAHMSPLNVGIGVDAEKGTIVLHHRDLPADQPLFVLRLGEASSGQLRRLGINAARLVKSEPLVLSNEPEERPKDFHLGNQPVDDVSDDVVEEIVQRILAELARA